MAMRWERLLTAERLQDKLTGATGEIGRTPFHKDHDRIIFAGSFRRLGRKTQVHPLTENDHIHTRLTHSLEVGCVGRSLGMMVGELLQEELPHWIQPADLGVIVQSGCLAHDIGNPPFGHAGEFAIRDWFTQAERKGLLDGLNEAQRRDLLTYEGNAQGFRVITQIEYNQFFGGMRLTYATLGAFLKYPWTAEHASGCGKFSCYQAEKHLLEAVAERLGLVRRGEWAWCRHPLSYLVEAADDICYALLDLEDGLEMGILGFEEVESLLAGVADGYPAEYARLQQASQRRRIAALRGLAMERMVAAASHAFVEHREVLLAGAFEGELIDVCDDHIRDGVHRAKELARTRIFRNKRKAKLEIGAYTTLGTLLEAFCGAAWELKHEQRNGFKHQRVLSLIGENIPDPNWPLYDAYMRVLDFIGGMTDHYAVDLAQEMGGYIRG